ncbi:AMP-dependent synthetase and ligase [Sterolibacterium denitrificans]|uniref:AMP-dependent synthetase and ligase n=1 Tax=Sterolibacterium denitrificans TaxID=157592 RepID=A0A7Z7HQ84_9PROT|nr:AMP-binding protein [Sterolibacterium denitrificans]SMB21045.1 AMP-dependent synthetase and ligase [Sterolibacterium denitrificans]
MRDPDTRNEFILADLIEIRAEQMPERDVLTFEHLSLDGGATPDEVRTYRQLDTHANRLAAHLMQLGLKKGERFVIMLKNHPEFVEAMIAASICGAVFVPVDPRARADKLAFMVRDSGSRGIICADYCLAEVSAARRQLPDVDWVLALASGEPGVPALGDYPEVAALAPILATPVPRVEPVAVTLDDPIQIIYTSGTTGNPKGIVGKNRRFGGTGLMGSLFGYGEDERPYTGLSLTHNNAQATALCPALFGGYRAVISRRFSKSKLWDICRHYGCTSFSLLGGMATAIYSEPPRPDDADNPVRLVISGGMPAGIWAAFERRFGVDIFEIYGASDGGGMAFRRPGDGPIGSFGKPMPGFVMKILDDQGNECAPGVVGEICCCAEEGGPLSVEVDYHGNPEASRQKLRDGWNRSGDMGHADADGWLYFDYRKGGGIRHNGDFINPGFVEKVIAEDPQVDDVFVFGVPAASGAPGESDVVAAIVPVDRASFDPAAVFRTCRAGLEPNFVPSFLLPVDEIPKTASEKPLERELVERYSRDRAAFIGE